MANPHRSAAIESHNAKLHRMTSDYAPDNDYGEAANVRKPSASPRAIGLGEGRTGGDLGSASRGRTDIPRRARGGHVSKHKHGDGGPSGGPGGHRHAGAPKFKGNDGGPMGSEGPHRRKHGGKVHRKRADGGDVSSIEEANRDQAATNKATGGAVITRARGGRAGHKKGSTHVNVIVAPQGGGGAGTGAIPPVVPIGGPAGPGPVPPPMPPRPPMAAGPMPMPPPGAMPPGAIPPRARGGRVHHEDEAEDKALIKKTLRDEGLVRKHARGGAVEHHGKRLPHQPPMHAGGGSGEGRLAKIGESSRIHDAGKPQVV